MCSELWVMWYELCVISFMLWVVCYGLWIVCYVLYVICYELWVMGYVNLCGMNCKKSTFKDTVWQTDRENCFLTEVDSKFLSDFRTDMPKTSTDRLDFYPSGSTVRHISICLPNTTITHTHSIKLITHNSYHITHNTQLIANNS